jgi:hypothetical protein
MDNYALRAACAYNHPDIVRFLIAPSPVASKIGAALDAGVAQWLFREAALAGHGELAQVLSAHAGINNAWLAAHAAPHH